jgi:hypothetical protein
MQRGDTEHSPNSSAEHGRPVVAVVEVVVVEAIVVDDASRSLHVLVTKSKEQRSPATKQEFMSSSPQGLARSLQLSVVRSNWHSARAPQAIASSPAQLAAGRSSHVKVDWLKMQRGDTEHSPSSRAEHGRPVVEVVAAVVVDVSRSLHVLVMASKSQRVAAAMHAFMPSVPQG